nr:MAG TPA: hypothetical protein [Caudoviricetes sp.]
MLFLVCKKKNTPFSECASHEIERDENTVAYLQALKVYHVFMRTFLYCQANEYNYLFHLHSIIIILHH